MSSKSIIILVIILAAFGAILVGLIGEEATGGGRTPPTSCEFTVGKMIGDNYIYQSMSNKKTVKTPELQRGDSLTIYLDTLITFNAEFSGNATNYVEFIVNVNGNYSNEYVTYQNFTTALTFNATNSELPKDLVVEITLMVKDTTITDTLVFNNDTSDKPIPIVPPT